MTRLVHLARSIERRIGNVGLAILAAIVFGVAIFGISSLSGSASTTATTTTSTSSSVVETTSTTVSTTETTATQRNGIDGLSAVSFTVKPKGGQAKTFCGLLAETPEQQAKGLMYRSDLAGYDGMIFAFSKDVTSKFYMANVPIPLSIAWFDKSGVFVSSTDMPPCTVEAAKCPLFAAKKAYRTALETLKGGLSGLGAGAGSVLTIGATGPC